MQVAAIGAAYLNPALGMRGGPLKVELVVDKVAVMLIFLLSGLSLQFSELKAAVTNTKLNGLIQVSSCLEVYFVELSFPMAKCLQALMLVRLLSSHCLLLALVT